MHQLCKLMTCMIIFAFSGGMVNHANASISEVPVLLWSNKNDVSSYFEPVSAALKINEFNFQENYVERLFNSDFSETVNTVVIFLQDKLSIEDFTKYGNAYGSRSTPPAYRYLKSLVTGSDSSSVFLPSVTNAGVLLEHVGDESREAWDKVVLKSGHYKLDTEASAVLPQENRRLVILVYLPEIKDDVEMGMRNNDEIVQSVISSLESINKKYVAVFTGLKPSHVVEYISHDRLRRDVNDDVITATEAPEINTTVAINFDNCTLFYAKKIQLNVLTTSKDTLVETVTKSVALKAENVVLDDERPSECYLTNSTEPAPATLYLKYTDTQSQGGVQINKLKIAMEFTVKKSGEWMMSAFNLTYDLKIANQSQGLSKEDEPLLFGDWSAPKSYSYHCDDTGNVAGQPARNDTDSREYSADTPQQRVALQFMGFQVQPTVTTKSMKFGRGYDCQVFFTPPILMGIVVGALLIYIFMYGMMMIMNLKTMDRFDDPKGKTITVPQTD